MEIWKTIVEALWGSKNESLLRTLILLVAWDYITGICVAIRKKKLSSKIGVKGISLKVLIFIVLSICHILDEILLGGSSAIQSMTLIFYCSNEVISILENVSSVGVPLPQKLKDTLSILKKDNKQSINK